MQDPRPDEQTVLSLRPAVDRVACAIHRTLPPRVAELEDLKSVAMLGALRAIAKFSPDHGVTLEQFAAIKARGAILDHFRVQDHLSRGHRQAVKQGGENIPRLFSLDTPLGNGGPDTWEAWIQDFTSGKPALNIEARLTIRKLLKRAGLDRRSSYIVRENLLRGRKLALLAERLGIHESRASQLRKAALRKLRAAYEKPPRKRRPRNSTFPIELTCRRPECGRRFVHLRETDKNLGIRIRTSPRKGSASLLPAYCSLSCAGKHSGGAPQKLPDRATLLRLYQVERLNMREIAERYDCNRTAVVQAFERHGIPARAAGGGWKRLASACPKCRTPCVSVRAAREHCRIAGTRDPKPTACRRCGHRCPSIRAARAHCRLQKTLAAAV